MKAIDWYKVRHYAGNCVWFVPRLVLAPIVVPVLHLFTPLLMLIVIPILALLTGQIVDREPTVWELTRIWLWPSY